MKKIFLVVTTLVAVSVHAQTTTDSLSTSIGDFVLVTSENADESSGYSSEVTTTSDGGTSELITPEASGARLAAVPVANDLQMRLAPNPSSGLVELNISGVEGATSIVVTDLLGQIIYTADFTVNNTRTTYLPAQLWASGTYIVVASCGGKIASERLIIN